MPATAIWNARGYFLNTKTTALPVTINTARAKIIYNTPQSKMIEYIIVGYRLITKNIEKSTREQPNQYDYENRDKFWSL